MSSLEELLKPLNEELGINVANVSEEVVESLVYTSDAEKLKRVYLATEEVASNFLEYLKRKERGSEEVFELSSKCFGWGLGVPLGLTKGYEILSGVTYLSNLVDKLKYFLIGLAYQTPWLQEALGTQITPDQIEQGADMLSKAPLYALGAFVGYELLSLIGGSIIGRIYNIPVKRNYKKLSKILDTVCEAVNNRSRELELYSD